MADLCKESDSHILFTVREIDTKLFILFTTMCSLMIGLLFMFLTKKNRTGYKEGDTHYYNVIGERSTYSVSDFNLKKCCFIIPFRHKKTFQLWKVFIYTQIALDLKFKACSLSLLLLFYLFKFYIRNIRNIVCRPII